MYTRIWLLVIIVFEVLLLSGCVSYSIVPYTLSGETNSLLKTLHNKHPDRKVRIRKITYTNGSQANTIDCRGVSDISTPTSKPYANYIRQALVKELKIADMYSSSGRISLSLDINKINVSSFSVLHGSWIIEGTITLSNDVTYNASAVMPFQTSFFGNSACVHAASAFEPVVQKFIFVIFNNTDFIRAME